MPPSSCASSTRMVVSRPSSESRERWASILVLLICLEWR
jgi:hypothetical protein